MTNPHVLSGELKAGRRRKTVVTHVLRSWEARNVKKRGDLMGVYLVLLDEKIWDFSHITNTNKSSLNLITKVRKQYSQPLSPTQRPAAFIRLSGAL
ncbi:hypothetical protein F2Q70_00002304 [Brassica cretica]|uniref:Uncharacterized protein n=1 Tax=Brassica cretica TaxID=69181 RepID=A0A8S9IXR2_BRACR|nr:hypothetical protein F2Q70_00002304 [Brassica cretica]